MHELMKLSTGSLMEVLGEKMGEIAIPKPFEQEIYLSSAWVAGTTYVPNILDLEPGVNVDDPIHLYREPENRFDPFAILVMTERDEKLGYVPRAGNHIYARLMDAGKLLHGRLLFKEIRGDHYLALRVGIWMRD